MAATSGVGRREDYLASSSMPTMQQILGASGCDVTLINISNNHIQYIITWYGWPSRWLQ